MPRIPNRGDTLTDIAYMDRTAPRSQDWVRVRGERAQAMRRQGYPTGPQICGCEACYAEWLSNTVDNPIRTGHAARWYLKIVLDEGLRNTQGRPPWFYTQGMLRVPAGYERHSTNSPRRRYSPDPEEQQRRTALEREALRVQRDNNAIHPAHLPPPAPAAPDPNIDPEYPHVDMSGYVPHVWGPVPTQDDGWSPREIDDEISHRASQDRRARRSYAQAQEQRELVLAEEARLAAARQSRIDRRASRSLETPMPVSDGSMIEPFRNLLPKGGRVWSAEVEVNVLTPGEAATALGVGTGQYSTRPDVPSVVASSDSTVDAEIKVSCMRDGAPRHAAYALQTYLGLQEAGAMVHANCGHHVHVDATRCVDQGRGAVLRVGFAASKLGRLITPALLPICCSGFPRPRGYSGEGVFVTDSSLLASKGHALHAARAVAQAQTDNLAFRGATFEFRMPNGTLEPLRAHSYIAIALSLIDFGERVELDREPEAVRAMETIDEWLDHARTPDATFATRFMYEHMAFSDDSLMALMATALTSTMVDSQSKRLWMERAPRPVPAVLNTLMGV